MESAIKQNWKVGDKFWQASRDDLHGCGCEVGPERDIKSDADRDLIELVAEFDDESEYGDAGVYEFEIDGIDEETGEITDYS